jgi:hypothetical protein
VSGRLTDKVLRCEWPWRLVTLVIMPSPAEGKIDDFSRRRDPVKCPECFEQHSPLLQDVPRLPERVAERPAQEDGAWRSNLLGEFSHDRYADGGDAGFLDLSLDQPHGLIADASGRSQQDQVDMVLAELFRHLLRRNSDQGRDVPAIDVAHERIMSCGQTADHALLLQFP